MHLHNFGLHGRMLSKTKSKIAVAYQFKILVSTLDEYNVF